MTDINDFYLSEPRVDAVSAWDELSSFTRRVGTELDDRAHPDYEPEDDKPEDVADQARDEDDEVIESEPEDYDLLLKAIRFGHITIDDSAALTVNLVCAIPTDDKDGELGKLIFDPKTWNYTEATYALGDEPAAAPVSKRARKRAPKKVNRIKQLDRCVEILCGQPTNMLSKVRHRRDRDVINRLAHLMLLG